MHHRNPSNLDAKNKADAAIQTALFRFPTVIGYLLEKNEVNTASRSFQTDWPSVFEFVNELTKEFEIAASMRSHRAYQIIVQIFVQQNFNLWSSSAVLKWVYDNLLTLKITHNAEINILPLSPAITRYARCDPMHFTDKFQTMPEEANPLDPGAVAMSLTIDTNRPRLIQRVPRGT
jgi:Transcriptional repressor TCF25